MTKKAPLAYGCSFVRDYQGSFRTSSSHDRTDSCLEHVRCDELEDPRASSFGAEYGYRSTTRFTDRVTFIGTCGQHTPLTRPEALEEAERCAADASCVATPPAPDSLRPAVPLAYGCTFRQQEWNFITGINPLTEECMDGVRCSQVQGRLRGKSGDPNIRYTVSASDDILGTCKDPVKIAWSGDPDTECRRAARSCVGDPNCVAYRDCISACRFQADCSEVCYQEGEPTAKANYQASARCAALGSTSVELSTLFPER